MATPRLLLGSARNGRILLVGETHQDAGQPVDIRATTNPLAPAGANRDCSFDRVYVTITRSAQVHLRCTPIIDFEHITGGMFDIELPRPPLRRSTVTERVLRRLSPFGPYLEGLRGRWFQLEIESVGGIFEGELILDQVDLEWEALSPTVREG